MVRKCRMLVQRSGHVTAMERNQHCSLLMCCARGPLLFALDNPRQARRAGQEETSGGFVWWLCVYEYLFRNSFHLHFTPCFNCNAMTVFGKGSTTPRSSSSSLSLSLSLSIYLSLSLRSCVALTFALLSPLIASQGISREFSTDTLEYFKIFRPPNKKLEVWEGLCGIKTRGNVSAVFLSDRERERVVDKTLVEERRCPPMRMQSYWPMCKIKWQGEF